MKRLSIRAKITLWFALAMSVLAALTLGCVWMISDNVVQKNIKDSLVEMVSDNVDEVEYYRNKEDANPDGDRDIYIQYKNGYLEIDDDYLDQMNGIYTTLYKEDYELLYGENPIAEASGDIAFADNKLQTLRYKGTTYYLYDRSLKGEGMEDLWLRGIVSRSQGARWMDAIVILSMWLIPVLILLALAGGYFLAGRFLRPIQQMIQAASGIQQGQDLKKRIELNKGQDELHQLASLLSKSFSLLSTYSLDSQDECFEKIERIEDRIDELTASYRQAQIERLMEKKVNALDCVIYSEILTDVERVSDHIMNIIQEAKRCNFTLSDEAIQSDPALSAA